MPRAKQNDTVAETERLETQVLGGVPATIPDWMKQDTEALDLNPDFDQSQIKLPQLKICQSMTPERKPGPDKIAGLEEGNLFIGATSKNYGNGPLPFVMLKFWTNITRSNADKTAMVCRAPGGNCQCSEDLKAGRVAKGTTWGPNGEKPPCTLWFNYLFFLLDTQETVWFSAKSTFIKKMKDFHASLRGIQGVPDFAKVFTLASTSKPGAAPGQDYYLPSIPKLPISIITNPGMYADLKQRVIDLKDKDVDTSAAEVNDGIEEGEVATGESQAAKDQKVPF
jgi:hypothetical protein